MCARILPDPRIRLPLRLAAPLLALLPWLAACGEDAPAPPAESSSGSGAPATPADGQPSVKIDVSSRPAPQERGPVVPGRGLSARDGEPVPRFTTADQYLREIALAKAELPRLDPARADEPGYEDRIAEEKRAVYARVLGLVQGLYEMDGNHGHVRVLLPERWQAMCRELGQTDRAVAEIEAVLERDDLTPAVEREMLYSLAMAHVAKLNDDFNSGAPLDEERAAAAEQAVTRYLEASDPPNPLRDASLLYDLARTVSADPMRQGWAYSELAARFPESRLAATARGWLRRGEHLGEPFELAFDDAITGEPFDVASLRGRVVIVSFWSTEHPLCLEELEDHKLLLAQHPDDLAIVGISLDGHAELGGLDALKAVVEGQEIPWPQHHDGHKFRGPLATEWGITRIPEIFVLDRQGRLFATDAHGRLEETVAKALAAGE